MKQKCGDCGYFESKGLMSGSTKWGLCNKFSTVTGNKESPIFRWEDDTCSNFEGKKGLSGLKSHSDKTR